MRGDVSVFKGHQLDKLKRAIAQSGSVTAQFDFTASDWTAGTPNQLQIVNIGSRGPGIIGAHGFGTNKTFHVTVFDGTRAPMYPKVDVEVSVNITTGQITIIKTGLGPAFAGRVVVS